MLVMLKAAGRTYDQGEAGRLSAAFREAMKKAEAAPRRKREAQKAEAEAKAERIKAFEEDIQAARRHDQQHNGKALKDAGLPVNPIDVPKKTQP